MINASPETVRALTKVFQLAGILDDRASHPDKARIAAWAEQVQRHRLTEPDLLDGLQTYYDNPSERSIQIGDLIHHARQIRRDRNEREAAVELEQRNQIHDAKAVEEIHGIAAGFVPGPAPNTDRLTRAKIALQCCNGKNESQAAIKEFFAAKTAAGKGDTK